MMGYTGHAGLQKRCAHKNQCQSLCSQPHLALSQGNSIGPKTKEGFTEDRGTHDPHCQ